MGQHSYGSGDKYTNTGRATKSESKPTDSREKLKDINSNYEGFNADPYGDDGDKRNTLDDYFNNHGPMEGSSHGSSHGGTSHEGERKTAPLKAPAPEKQVETDKLQLPERTHP